MLFIARQHEVDIIKHRTRCADIREMKAQPDILVNREETFKAVKNPILIQFSGYFDLFVVFYFILELRAYEIENKSC